jgi:hypothetical protein
LGATREPQWHTVTVNDQPVDVDYRYSKLTNNVLVVRLAKPLPLSSTVQVYTIYWKNT